jgi:hypothetical protein
LTSVDLVRLALEVIVLLMNVLDGVWVLRSAVSLCESVGNAVVDETVSCAMTNLPASKAVARFEATDFFMVRSLEL